MRLRRGRALGCVAGIGASGDEESRDFSHFEDDRQDERALGSLLVDVAFQVHADFFFDDAPVRLFLGVGLLDRPDNDVARPRDELLPVVAQKSSGDDFRQRFDFPRVFVDGDDRHDDAVFGEVLPVANDELLDLFERAGIDQNAARRKRFPAISALSGKFNWLPIFDEQDFSRHYAKLMRQGCVTKQMPVFAMNWDEVARSNELMSCGRTTIPSGMRKHSRSCAISTLSTMLRPTKATFRPTRCAISMTCWMRWMDDAKQESTTLRGAVRQSSSMRGTTARSVGVKPGRSTFVLSLKSARTPSLPQRAKACTSNAAPSTGVWSILKSPVWRITPSGVRTASATQSIVLCVTPMNSISYGPISMRRPGRTSRSVTLSSRAASSRRFFARARVKRVP